MFVSDNTQSRAKLLEFRPVKVQAKLSQGFLERTDDGSLLLQSIVIARALLSGVQVCQGIDGLLNAALGQAAGTLSWSWRYTVLFKTRSMSRTPICSGVFPACLAASRSVVSSARVGIRSESNLIVV